MIRAGFRRCTACLVLAGVLAAGGCAGGRSRRVAVIPRLSADAQWLSLHVGIAEEAEKLHLRPSWHGPSGDQALQEQIQLLTEAAQSETYGIIVAPGAYVAENRMIDQALKKDIPVVVLSEKIALPKNPHLFYVLENPHAAGDLIAGRLKHAVGAGEVAVLGLDPDVPGSLEHADAIEASLHSIAPEIHVASRIMHAARESDLAREVRTLLTTHREIQALVALSAGEGRSAAAAIASAGAQGRVKLIVCDQSIDLFLLLRSGAVDSIVVQQNRSMGVRAMDAIAEDRAGRRPPAEVVFDPVLVTAENIDSAPVQEMLLMHRSPPW